MKYWFRQRFFSWFDSYDIYDESGDTVFTVEGQLSWGHKLVIYDGQGRELGLVREELLTLLPRFSLSLAGQVVGEVQKEFTFFAPSFRLDCRGWQVDGDFFGWDYAITDAQGRQVAGIHKELFQLTDAYVLDVAQPADAIYVLMVALAIDAVRCDN